MIEKMKTLGNAMDRFTAGGGKIDRGDGDLAFQEAASDGRETNPEGIATAD